MLWWYRDSDARDRLLVALSRLLDSMVDVLALGASTEGVDAALREELTAKLSGLLGGSDDERDLFAVYTVRMPVQLSCQWYNCEC